MKTGFDFKKIQLLSSLNKKTLEQLKNSVVYKKYSKGSLVFNEGERPRGLYFLASGEVGIYKTMKDESEVQLHKISRNQPFGEVSLLAGIPYNDFARAEKNIEVYFLAREDFDALIKKDPNTAISISLFLTQKLTELRQRIIHERNKTTIAVFYNEGNQKEKSWLAMETALSLKDQTKKKVLLLDMTTNPQDIQSILNKKLDYDFIIINLPQHKNLISAAIVFQADFLLNMSDKKLNFYNKLYNRNIRVINIDLAKERRLNRMDWYIGHLARVISHTTIGLALGSGTVGGIAHIGVLKYFQENKIPIDMIAGCSGGALYGSLFAFKNSWKFVEEIVRKQALKGFSGHLDFAWSLKGFARGKIIEKVISNYIGADKKIEEMKVPISIVATDLVNHSQVIFNRGNLWKAIRASMSLPIIFTPLETKESVYIDGNTTNPLPIDVLKDAKIDKIIAVYATQTRKHKKYKINNFIDVYLQSRAITNDKLAKESAKNASTYIGPDVSDFGIFEYSRYRELIDLGYKTASKTLKHNMYI